MSGIKAIEWPLGGDDQAARGQWTKPLARQEASFVPAVRLGGIMNLLMLSHEASRLGSQQEQSHGCIISGLAVAATMIDDMRMRKLSEKTQSHYLRWVQRPLGALERLTMYR